MGDKDVQYGVILIAMSVFFLVSALDMMHFSPFGTGFSNLMAYVLVAIGTYLIAKGTK